MGKFIKMVVPLPASDSISTVPPAIHYLALSCQAKAGAQPARLRGEEHVEGSPLDRLGHPGAIVGYTKFQLRPSGSSLAQTRIALAAFAARRAGDCLAGIHNQVQHCLRE